MRELGRLLRFSRPYTPHLIFSVVLMVCVGAAQGLMALLDPAGFRPGVESVVGRNTRPAIHGSPSSITSCSWPISCRHPFTMCLPWWRPRILAAVFSQGVL